MPATQQPKVLYKLLAKVLLAVVRKGLLILLGPDMVSTIEGQPGSPEKEKFHWAFCGFERAGPVAEKTHHGETQSDHFTDSASTLSHGDLCSAAQAQLPHQLMVLSRPGAWCSFLRSPEKTHPWDRQTQAHKGVGALPCIWALTSDMPFCQPLFLPSSSSLSAINWLYRLLL